MLYVCAIQEKMVNIEAALVRVKHFLDTVSPFPRNGMKQ